MMVFHAYVHKHLYTHITRHRMWKKHFIQRNLIDSFRHWKKEQVLIYFRDNVNPWGSSKELRE